jgi:flagellin-like protein
VAALEAGSEELTVRRKGVSPVTGLWLLLAVVVTVYRSCTGG